VVVPTEVEGTQLRAWGIIPNTNDIPMTYEWHTNDILWGFQKWRYRYPNSWMIYIRIIVYNK
jgi:hypothetical protein